MEIVQEEATPGSQDGLIGLEADKDYWGHCLVVDKARMSVEEDKDYCLEDKEKHAVEADKAKKTAAPLDKDCCWEDKETVAEQQDTDSMLVDTDLDWAGTATLDCTLDPDREAPPEGCTG